MDRRAFLTLTGAVGTALAAEAEKPAPRRPNILVFLTDDHGQWAQHAYGNSELRTPHLDELAAQGTRMTNAFTTSPVCSPARASFFTGRMPSQHGIHDWLQEPEYYDHPALIGQTTLAMLLQKAGYYTGLVGKWHCGKEREPAPGFDSWFCHWKDQYPHRGEQNFSDQGKQIVEQGQQSPLLTDHALEFLQKHREDPAVRDKPFFLFVGYVDTHGPHKDAPDDLIKQYESATFHDIPDETFADCHGELLTKKATTPEAERQRRVQYYGAVSSIDREIGRIMAALEASGQKEETLIVYTGDHGLNGGHHGMWEKGNGTQPQNFIEESIKVPCTIRWPKGGIRQKAVCEDMVDHCDLWNTLLDAAQALPDAETTASINSPGRSYLAALQGTSSGSGKQAQISEYGNARMIRTKRYKLILRFPYKGVRASDELYDLQKDPRETVNVITDPALKSVVEELIRQLQHFFSLYTVAGHSGLGLEHQPTCTNASPWLRSDT
jgi:choline-sulfatase